MFCVINLMEYYVYALLDTRKPSQEFGFEPFYIGKGKNNRGEMHLSINNFEINSNPKKVNKINSIRKNGYEPKFVKIKEFLDENAAYDFEAELIKKYGRSGLDENGVLTNLCADSRPPSRKGAKISQEQKEAISIAVRRRLSGKTYEELYGEERAKIVKRNVGNATKARSNNISHETREKLSKANSRSYVEIYGSIEEAERQAKIRSEKRIGQKRTPEQRQRISEGNKGRIPGNAKKIIINNIEFSSMTKAAQFLKIELSTLFNILKRNKINENNIEIESLSMKKFLKEKIKKILEEYNKNAYTQSSYKRI